MSLFTDDVSNLITNTILNNLGCFGSANTLTQAQIININCNPPSNWGQVVYNGEICKLARQTLQPNDPRLCTFCYACCVTDTNQNNFLQIKNDCGIDDVLLAKIKQSITSQLSTLNPNVAMPASLTTLLDTITTTGVNKAITDIISVQNININGVGVQSRVNQSIVASIMLNTIRTPEFIEALNKYLSDLKSEQQKAPPSVPITSTPTANKPPPIITNKPINKSFFTYSNIIYIFISFVCFILIILMLKQAKSNLSSN
jgi:hypothetical protein